MTKNTRCNQGNICPTRKHRKGTTCPNTPNNNPKISAQSLKAPATTPIEKKYRELKPGEVIGTMVIAGGTANKTYETASWYTTVEYEEQEIEIKLNSNGRMYGTVQGVVTEENFPSSYGGNMTGGGTFTKDTMKETTHTFSWYDYELAKAIDDGEMDVELLEGIEVYTEDFDHPIYCSGLENLYDTCECEAHVDAHGNLIEEKVPERGNYGEHFKGGYKADGSGKQIEITKAHYKIGEAIQD